MFALRMSFYAPALNSYQCITFPFNIDMARQLSQILKCRCFFTSSNARILSCRSYAIISVAHCVLSAIILAKFLFH